MEAALPADIVEGGLCLLHRADGAENVAELLGGIILLHYIVLAFIVDVIGVIGQQDQAVALQIQRLDDPAEEGLHRVLVLQRGVPQRHEQPMLIAVHHLLGAEAQIQQIAANRSGHDLAEKRQELFTVLFPHHGQRLLELRDDLLALIDITSVDIVDISLIQPQPTAQLTDFLFVHSTLSLAKLNLVFSIAQNLPLEKVRPPFRQIFICAGGFFRRSMLE